MNASPLLHLYQRHGADKVSPHSQFYQNHPSPHTQFYQNHPSPHTQFDQNRSSKPVTKMDHKKHHDKKRVKPRSHRKAKNKQSSWQSIFCMDGKVLNQAKEVCQPISAKQFCSGHSNKKWKSSKRGAHTANSDFDHIRVYDGSYIPIDFRDDASTDWDQMKGVKQSKREGPTRKSSTELQIQLADLFPCLGDIFDFLGCSKKKKTRARAIQRSVGNHKLPQLETVCLECGHILDQKNLEKSILRDAGNHLRGMTEPMRNAKIHMPQSERPAALFDYGYGDVTRDWEKESAYSGYNGWQYQDDVSNNSAIDEDFDAGLFDDTVYGTYQRKNRPTAKHTPLPKFHLTHPRAFKSRPKGPERHAAAPRAEYFDVDDTGHISLPRFTPKNK